MTHGKGTNPENEGEKIFVGQEKGFISTEQGNFVTGETVLHSEGMSGEEIREGLADVYGVDPSKVHLGKREIEKRAGRGAVGFTKWNSSWDPHADKNKGSDNPDLN